MKFSLILFLFICGHASLAEAFPRIVVTEGTTVGSLLRADQRSLSIECLDANCEFVGVKKTNMKQSTLDRYTDGVFNSPDKMIFSRLNFIRLLWRSQWKADSKIDGGELFAPFIMAGTVAAIFLGHAAPKLFETLLFSSMGAGSAWLAYLAARLPMKFRTSAQVHRLADQIGSWKSEHVKEIDGTTYVEVTPRAFDLMTYNLVRAETPKEGSCVYTLISHYD
jgi:hypothetical protein